jgi:hypothetical protein
VIAPKNRVPFFHQALSGDPERQHNGDWRDESQDETPGRVNRVG